MLDHDTFRLNLRRYLDHASLDELAVLADEFAEELATRGLVGAVDLHRTAAQVRAWRSAQSAINALAAAHAELAPRPAEQSPPAR
jgi:hypothetical protein